MKYCARQFIYDYDPFHLSIDFSQLPYVILEFPTVEYIRQSSDGKHKGILFKNRIVIRTVRHHPGKAGHLDIGRENLLNITDDLHKMFNVNSVRQTLINNKMHKMNLFELSNDFVVIDGKYMYEAVFEIQYETPFLNVNV